MQHQPGEYTSNLVAVSLRKGHDSGFPVLIFIIAALVLVSAVLLLRSPEAVTLTADQIMPSWGP